MSPHDDGDAFPTHLLLPEPGEVWWAAVHRDGNQVGAVWLATQPHARPRAGILNTPNVEHLDGPFQDVLGTATLRVSRDPTVEPSRWWHQLRATHNGEPGGLLVGEPALAPTLAAVREHLRTAD